MRCPFCGETDSKVLDSRAMDEGSCIRRRRECPTCSRRFTTHERLDELQLMVVKKDGRREPFHQSKIISGVLKATSKLPVPTSDVELLAEQVEREARNAYDREIDSAVIGDMVMDKLRILSQVAYVRFASVYREFSDVERFKQELDKLL